MTGADDPARLRAANDRLQEVNEQLARQLADLVAQLEDGRPPSALQRSADTAAAARVAALQDEIAELRARLAEVPPGDAVLAEQLAAERARAALLEQRLATLRGRRAVRGALWAADRLNAARPGRSDPGS